MTNREMWENYHTPGVGPGDDQNLLAMLQELVSTIRSIERIYGPIRSQLLVRSMIADYQTLSNMAWARGLKNIPVLIVSDDT